jgi:tRNA threonylcarbamoyladenosine biosynthesis protein TsaE
MAAERAAARRFESGSVAATEALGERLGRALVPGALLALDGELGTGKTALVRGLARGLGCEGKVTSPSFTLMHELPGPVPLYHFDAWMAGRETAFLEGGGAEHLAGEGVAAIEWAERVSALLPRPRLALWLAHRGPERRALELVLVTAGPGAGPRERALEAALARALAELEAPAGVSEMP